jgi:L-alanine-DL-glutamate epimerase-like enolase superfamily enzyme
MRITKVKGWKEPVPLSRPYTIATRRIEAVELVFVKLTTDTGLTGLGSGSPAEFVTGETIEACEAAVSPERLAWLMGRDARELGALTRELGERMREPPSGAPATRAMPSPAHVAAPATRVATPVTGTATTVARTATPAARAAVDMALYDLFARHLELPLVDVLGRCHDGLSTSITIGIKSEEEARDEAREYLQRGFRCLKVKIGLDLEADLARLRMLRETVGDHVTIRVDANQGYTVDETLELGRALDALGIEFVEQPLKADALDALRALPEPLRARIALDESLHDEADALHALQPPHPGRIFNIKLMKCGGITPALTIAKLAEVAGLHVMWGCMDESVVSIAAALHAAYACPATRYLDLDGSFDLARDVAEGGWTVQQGNLALEAGSGLGTRLRSD